MTRSTARHMAIQLCFASAASGRAPEELAGEFFSDEHFSTLAAEDELYAELPKGKYLDYGLRVDLKHNAFASPDGRGERGGHDERRQP